MHPLHGTPRASALHSLSLRVACSRQPKPIQPGHAGLSYLHVDIYICIQYIYVCIGMTGTALDEVGAFAQPGQCKFVKGSCVATFHTVAWSLTVISVLPLELASQLEEVIGKFVQVKEYRDTSLLSCCISLRKYLRVYGGQRCCRFDAERLSRCAVLADSATGEINQCHFEPGGRRCRHNFPRVSATCAESAPESEFGSRCSHSAARQ